MTKNVIRTVDDLPSDHWIARQLPAGTSLRPYAEDEAISAITAAVQDAIKRAGLSRSEVAGLLGTTKSYVSQALNGSTNMTLRTLGALLWAAGRQVRDLWTEPLGATPEATAEYPAISMRAFQVHTANVPPLHVGGSTHQRVRQTLTTTLPSYFAN
ncbi:MAG: helix-turn-helix transcriptional regulator [Gemmatimonadaceae bacterium]